MDQDPEVITNKEIERKFLVASLPENLDSYPHNEITQGYIAVGEDGTEVRLRGKGDKYFQTVKSKGSRVRDEFEIEITKDQFNTLWPTTEGKRLEKTRYEIPQEEFIIELDIYRGKLAGLITVEVEFRSEDQADSFKAPAWFGEDVTGRKEYKNRNLATRGLLVP